MYRKVSVFSFIFVMILFACFSSSCLAESWYDGVPQAGLDWLKSIARSVDDLGPGTYSKSVDGITITVQLIEGTDGDGDSYVETGRVTISDRGTRDYVGYYADRDALSEINAAVSKEELGAVATANSFAFNTNETDQNKAPLVSSETPVASADRTGLRIVETIAVPKASTKEQKQRIKELASGKAKLIGGTATYEEFDYFDIKGKTYEVLSGLEKDFEKYSLGVFVPFSYVDVTGGDWTKLGATGFIKKEYLKENWDFSLGFNVTLEQTWMGVKDVNDSFAYGAGPMASCTVALQDIEVSLGGNLLYMGNTEYESVGILTTGVNIGIPLGSHFVVNLTTYRTDNFDSDNDYWQVGGTASYLVSDVFELIFGITTITGLDNFDSNAYQIGGLWRY